MARLHEACRDWGFFWVTTDPALIPVAWRIIYSDECVALLIHPIRRAHRIASQVENHGVDAALMDEVKRFVYAHYEEHLEAKFHASHLARSRRRAGRLRGRQHHLLPPRDQHRRLHGDLAGDSVRRRRLYYSIVTSMAMHTLLPSSPSISS